MPQYGYYLSKYTGPDYNGNLSTIYFLLIFTKKGFVGFDEIEDILEWRRENTNELIKETIFEVNKINEIEVTPNLTNYYISKGGISMKFFNSEEYENKDDIQNSKSYSEWQGSIIHNGLILSFDRTYYNYALLDYTKETMFKNLKFEFMQIKF